MSEVRLLAIADFHIHLFTFELLGQILAEGGIFIAVLPI